MANFGDIAINTPVATAMANEGFGVGAITASSDGSGAGAGKIGDESVTVVILSLPVSLTTGTPTNVASLPLSAGDWDIEAQVTLKYTGATQSGDGQAGISLVSAALPNSDHVVFDNTRHTVVTSNKTLTIARNTYHFSPGTTFFLVAQASFSAGTCGAFGFIHARRVR